MAKIKIDTDKQIKRLKEIGVDEHMAKSYLYDLEKDLKKDNQNLSNSSGEGINKYWEWYKKQPGHRKALIPGAFIILLWWLWNVYAG